MIQWTKESIACCSSTFFFSNCFTFLFSLSISICANCNEWIVFFISPPSIFPTVIFVFINLSFCFVLHSFSKRLHIAPNCSISNQEAKGRFRNLTLAVQLRVPRGERTFRVICLIIFDVHILFSKSYATLLDRQHIC